MREKQKINGNVTNFSKVAAGCQSKLQSGNNIYLFVTITEPEPDSELEQGELPIRGVARSGAAPIARVEVRIGGSPWQNARLVGERKRHSWQGGSSSPALSGPIR